MKKAFIWLPHDVASSFVSTQSLEPSFPSSLDGLNLRHVSTPLAYPRDSLNSTSIYLKDIIARAHRLEHEVPRAMT